MVTIEEIQTATKEVADIEQLLRERKNNYELGIMAVKKKYYPGIRSAAQRLGEKITALTALIKGNIHLFKKPRTRTFFGIRVGIKKEKGKLEIINKDKTIELIKKYYPDTWETYVRTDEKPIKKALETLPATELKKLGVRVKEDTDEVYIKSQDSEIDKFVEAILKDKDIDEEAA